MPFQKWFRKVEKKVAPVTEWTLFWRVSFFSLMVLAAIYAYMTFLTPPYDVNKAVANASVVLVSLSMVLSSVCYFWDAFDTKIIYRKHLGIVGFAYGLAHMVLSQRAFWRLFELPFLSQRTWPAMSGLVAIIIFAIMTLISNNYSALKLGGQVWRKILRTGYIALIFVWIHVVLLSKRDWIAWWNQGPDAWPPMSLVTTLFLVWVVGMRLLLWWSLKKKVGTTSTR